MQMFTAARVAWMTMFLLVGCVSSRMTASNFDLESLAASTSIVELASGKFAFDLHIKNSGNSEVCLVSVR